PVFGWTFQNFGGTYEMIHAEGEMIGALDASRQGSTGDGVALYFSVADLEDTLARVVANGGSVVTDRVEIGGDMGWSAVFRDPDGFRIGLWTGTPAKEDAGS
ncbi:MAG: VOC family protein, partial [Acidothermales bacterium]|nr:VOC family protein [Acidothermales bacterium]